MIIIGLITAATLVILTIWPFYFFFTGKDLFKIIHNKLHKHRKR